MEKPILFSSSMVKAILEGRKTQTRRGIKRINDLTNEHFVFTLREVKQEFGYAGFDGLLPTGVICPYGIPGDTLWVREQFGWYNHIISGSYGYISPEKPRYPPHVIKGGFKKPVIFKADYPKHRFDPDDSGWKPSIHMPKTACRIWLEITNIRVERLHDITEQDAQAEGADFQKWEGISETTQSYKNGFTSTWLYINGDDSWNCNPWVWVIEFKIKEILK